jgi:hypothetical protein
MLHNAWTRLRWCLHHQVFKVSLDIYGSSEPSLFPWVQFCPHAIEDKANLWSAIWKRKKCTLTSICITGFMMVTVFKTGHATLVKHCSQGDQIGRIFAQWATVYFGQFFLNYRSSPHMCSTFFLCNPKHRLLMYKFWQNIGWAIFWAIFSQTHLWSFWLQFQPG